MPPPMSLLLLWLQRNSGVILCTSWLALVSMVPPVKGRFFLGRICWWNTRENMALCPEATEGRTRLWLQVGVALCSEWDRIYREKVLEHHAWALVQCDTSVRRSGGVGHSGETVLCLHIYISKQASSRKGTHLQIDMCIYPNSISCQSLHLCSLQDLLSSWKCKCKCLPDLKCHYLLKLSNIFIF